ncbi:MAG TPA: aminotransferase class V-fold PLP-dependent enzyme [Acidimicrobiales bacterium]|nr:aminotransferase class V-fold PLP-dependent enzyme [Acidimicrobiales bacterium]
MSELLYFDHAASAPRRDEVVEAMAPWQHGVVGNPSGSHRPAREARRAIEEARDVVAEFVGARPGEVIFTAGGTESCQLAIEGTVKAHRRGHATSEIIVSRVEHNAVLDAAAMLARDYDDVVTHLLDVDESGVVDLDQLQQLVSENTAIVSVMTANNETGVRQPLDGVSMVTQTILASDVLIHTDAVAGAPWLNLAVVTASVDLVSLCAHKLGGPVNAGALIARGDANLEAIMPGGGQERGRRGGTVDVAAAVGLAKALELTGRELSDSVDRVLDLQLKLVSAISFLPGARITAPAAAKVPGTVHATFEGIASDELLFLLDQEGVCASAASSCSSGATQTSHVLEAMGVEHERAKGSLRLSMGAETTEAQVDRLIEILARTIHRLRTGL